MDRKSINGTKKGKTSSILSDSGKGKGVRRNATGSKLKGYNFTFGVTLTVIMVGLIILGFFWTPYDTEAMQGSVKLNAPSLAHVSGRISLVEMYSAGCLQAREVR